MGPPRAAVSNSGLNHALRTHAHNAEQLGITRLFVLAQRVQQGQLIADKTMFQVVSMSKKIAQLLSQQGASSRLSQKNVITIDSKPSQSKTRANDMIRPSFDTAWAASQRIYDPMNSGTRVAKVIGGNVKKNIDNPAPAQRWENTCAVRMSYILSQAGMRMPSIRGQTVSGADGRQYFFRVRDLIGFLTQQWGTAEVVKYPASGSGALAGKKGVILFEVSGWSNAQGHATLFNGFSCYDHCYFNEPEAKYRTNRANFWSLR